MKMKKRQLSLLALSIAATFAANVAYAGQIQSSSVSIAREVITLDTQAVVSPSVAYRFAGDVDARQQAQTFQVQFTLGSGTWAVAPTAPAISVSDGVTGAILDQNAATDYTVSNIGLSTDLKTLWATIIVNQGVARLVKQPLISVNVGSNTIAATTGTNTLANRGTINGLKTVVGDLPADYTAANAAAPWTANGCAAVKSASVSFAHYTALSNPAVIATTANATADEHLRSGATNTATLITFPTNILPVVTTSTGNATISAAGQNLVFSGSATAGAAPDSWVSATIVDLGKIAMTQNSTGYDSNLTNQYLLAGGGAGILAAATAVNNIGRVEAASLDVVVTPSTNGFVPGGTLWLDTAATCATSIVSGGGVATAITALNAAGPITLTIATAQLNAALGAATGIASVYTCYGVTGVTTAIPQSSFTVKATLTKSAAGAGLNEQNNVCGGNHYSLGGGVKIDVRNYANSKDPGGWMSVIRLINNNESRTIDVWGQLINPNGTYGPWGLLVSNLAPRAVLNLTSTQVDALLVNAPAHATTAYNGPATIAATPANGTGSRLRITSNAGSTLRVQNYLFNPVSQNFIEASGTQGVDFEGSTTRSPLVTDPGQSQQQDAQAGLNGH